MASKRDIIRRKPKPKKKTVEEPLCRIIPPLLARNLDVLDLVTTIAPFHSTSDIAMEVKNRLRKVNTLLREKFSGQSIE